MKLENVEFLINGYRAIRFGDTGQIAIKTEVDALPAGLLKAGNA